tara:strand:- start:88 stop:831 length:744 start_codon:yes stop_codon:yes gene_type:complete
MSEVVCIIPTHLDSKRFPRKALVEIEGLPMIVHVFKRAELCKALDGVYVATCDEEIKEVVENHGGKVIMTSAKHETGSDRIAEAAGKIDCDVVINVQGDEPLVHPEEIALVVKALKENHSIPCANLVCATSKTGDAGEGKVVFDKEKKILYYSREDIPTSKMGEQVERYKFCGVFGFRKDFLLQYTDMEQTPLEKAEFFEYNRILENGHVIKAVVTDTYSTSIDWPRDVETVNALMNEDDIKRSYLP